MKANVATFVFLFVSCISGQRSGTGYKSTDGGMYSSHDMDGGISSPGIRVDNARQEVDTIQRHINRIGSHQSRGRTTRNRMQAALLRARLRQIENQGLSAKQMQTENHLRSELRKLKRRPRWSRCYSCSSSYYPSYYTGSYSSYSDVSNYAASQVHYLQKTVGRMTATVRKMGVKVEGLEKWKKSSEERMKKLETLVAELTGNIALPAQSSGAAQTDCEIVAECMTRVDELQESLRSVNKTVEDLRNKDGSQTIAVEVRQGKGSEQEEAEYANTNDWETISQRCSDHGEAITNLSQVVSQQEVKIRRHETYITQLEERLSQYDRQIENVELKNAEHNVRLYNLTQKQNSTMENVGAYTARITGFESAAAQYQANAELEQAIEIMNETMGRQKSIVDRLYSRVGTTQRCCRMITLVSRRIATIERTGRGTRIRADNALKGLKVQKRKMDSVSTRLDAQKVLIHQLQGDNQDRDRTAVQSSERLIEMMKNHQEAMNSTMTAMYQDQWETLEETYSSRIQQLEANLLQSAEELRSLSQNTNMYIGRLNMTQTGMENMNEAHNDHRMTMKLNITKIVHRISRKEKELEDLTARVEGMQRIELENAGRALSAKVELDKTVQVLRDEIQTTSTNLRTSTNTEIRGYFTDISEKLIRLNGSFIEQSTSTSLFSKQLAEVRSHVNGVQALVEIRDGEIEVLKDKLEENEEELNRELVSIRQDVSRFKNDMDSCCDVTIDVIASLNVTFENYRSDQERKSSNRDASVERQRTLITELQERTTNMESQQNAVLAEVSEVSDTTESALAELRRGISANRHHNTKTHRDIRRLQNQTKSEIATISKNVDQLFITQASCQLNSDIARRDVKQMNETVLPGMRAILARMKEDVRKMRQNMTQLHALTVRMDEVAHTREDQKRTRAEVKALSKMVTLTKDDIEQVRNSSRQTTERFEEFEMLTKNNYDTLSAKMGESGELRLQHERRIQSLEVANSSLYKTFGNCNQELMAVKDGLKELRMADKVVSDALVSHEEAISSHDHLHRNLTTISEEIHGIMNQQGIALETIHEVMARLNKSFTEGQDVIDESFSAKLRGHKEELKTMRSAMSNFSSLMSKMLNDQLQHNIDHATMQNRQRSLMESFDLHDSIISELRSTATDNTKDVEKFRTTCNSNARKLLDISSELENHERRLRVLDTTGMDLAEANTSLSDMLRNGFADVKASFGDMRDRISNITKELEDFEKVGSVREETVDSYREQAKELWRVIKKNNRTLSDLVSRTSREKSTNDETISQVQADIATIREAVSSMRSRPRQIEEALRVVRALEKELSNQTAATTSIGREVEALKHYSLTMEKNINALNESRRNPPIAAGLLALQANKPCPCNEEAIAEHDKKISELTRQASNYNKHAELIAEDLSKVSSQLPRILRENEQVTAAFAKLTEHEAALQVLNASRIIRKRQLDGLRKSAIAQSNTIQSMQDSNAEVATLIQTLQSGDVQQSAKIAEMALKTEEMQHKIDFVESRLDSRNAQSDLSMKKALKQAEDLAANLTAMEARLSYLEYDSVTIYNSTQLAFQMLEEQAIGLSAISEESNALISSIVSSVDTLDYSLQDINQTMLFEINDIKNWLNDFQDAFDTSNRQMGRYGEEVKIMTANATQQFNHFSTSIDFLTQIVRETNEAVSENTERVNFINETLLIVRLSIPMLLANNPNGDFFDGENETDAKPFFDPADLVPKPVRRGDRRALPSLSGEDDYDLDAILNGEADDVRAQRQLDEWITNNPFTTQNADYPDNYDFDSLDRRKRLVKDVRRVDTEMSTIRSLIRHLKSKVDVVENKTLETEIGMERVTSNNDKIAFSAGLSNKFRCCGVVIFDKIFSNSGVGYDPATGKFTSTSDGVYVFYATISQRNSFVSAAIFMNGMPQVTLRMDHSSGHYEQSQSTNSVILKMATGDKVWLQTYEGSLLGYQHPVVTFSGFRIG